MAFTRNINGFSLVEFLLVTALSLILLLALVGSLIALTKNYRDQVMVNNLYDQALIAGNLLQQSLVNAGDLGCRAWSTANQIENETNIAITSVAGIKIYQVGKDALPAILPKNVITKLLNNSVVIISEQALLPFSYVMVDENKQRLQLMDKRLQKHDLILLSNCNHAWLMHLDNLSRQNFTPPFSLTHEDLAFRAAKWQIIIWFVMKNTQGSYGLYRLILPDQTAPVELVSDIKKFQAEVLLTGTNGAQGSVIRLMIGLAKNQFSLDWPVSIALQRKIQSLRQL